ncbi:SRPBCC family protein [Pontimicrobium sp. SW4]|uniref:SRPBCC family protein n=1 Tax=Pontimicrobium sp. SW4 TaxID=3153519 RepID=A0AAU7BW15_9FLAO
MEIFLYVLAAIVLLIVVLGLIAPKTYQVRRSIIINCPLSETFDYLKLIKNQNNWSPWKKKDPCMEQTFEGTDGEVGFISRWKGNKGVGEGEQEIVSIIEDESIDTELRFFKPWKSQSIGHLLVDKVDDNQTMVTWGFSGRNPFPFNIFILFVNFEKAVGKDFEDGLQSLKKILDK